MTKNVIKIGAVVILICMLCTVGVSSVGAATYNHTETESAVFEINDVKAFWMQDGKLRWTLSEGFLQAPIINITANSTNNGYPYLVAYNVTVGGKLITDFGSDDTYFTLSNANEKFHSGSIVQNLSANYRRLASTVATSGTTVLEDISSPSGIIYLNFTKAGLNSIAGDDVTKYDVTVLQRSELGLVSENTVDGITLGENVFHKANSSEDVSFEFYIREGKPIVTSFTLDDYVVDYIFSEAHIYYEHGDFNITAKGTFNESFDNITWSIDDHEVHTGIINIDEGEKGVDIDKNKVYIHGDDGHRIDYEFDEDAYWYYFRIYAITNNNLRDNEVNKDHVGMGKSIKLYTSNWNRSMTSNNDTDIEQPTGRDGDCWDFTRGLSINYTVGAGSMLGEGNVPLSYNTPWASNVEIAKASTGSSGEKAWNAKVNYYWNETRVKLDVGSEFEINGVPDGGILYDIGGTNKTFNVSRNEIGDGDPFFDVLISLSGGKKGDADMDDNVDIVDSSIVGIDVIRAGGLIDPNSDNYLSADCNVKGGDGYITVADVLAINRFLVGLPPWTYSTTT